jgi:transcriptional regulator with XRE-family HTH domain
MRENLKAARRAKGMTQQQMADRLGISLRYYQNLEQGSRGGNFVVWDLLEEITETHQRKLRENEENHPALIRNPRER